MSADLQGGPTSTFDTLLQQLIFCAVEAHPIQLTGSAFSGSVDGTQAGSGGYSTKIQNSKESIVNDDISKRYPQ